MAPAPGPAEGGRADPVFFLATFAFSCFEFTLPLLVSDNFHLGIAQDPGRPATTVISLFVFAV